MAATGRSSKGQNSLSAVTSSPVGLTQIGTTIQAKVAPLNLDDFVQISQQQVESPNSDSPGNTDITVTGVEVVIGRSSQVHKTISEILRSKNKLNSLTIVADVVKINASLKLPSAKIFIYARELEIAKNVTISTEGKSRSTETRPAKTLAGKTGFHGGDIYLYVGSLDRNNSSKVQFITKGGNGQRPGIGISGKNGAPAEAWSSSKETESAVLLENIKNRDIDKYLRRKWVGDVREATVSIEIIRTDQNNKSRSWKAKPMPTDGGKAAGRALKPCGMPGKGGNAGNIYLLDMRGINLPKSSTAQTPGSAARPVKTKGGKAGYLKVWVNDITAPFPHVRMKKVTSAWKRVGRVKRQTFMNATLNDTIWETPTKVTWKDEKDHPGPIQTAKGKSGSITKKKRSAGWFHPLHASIYDRLLNRLFLNNDIRTLKAYLRKLDFGFEQIARSVGGQGRTEEDKKSVIALNVLRPKLDNLQMQMDSGMDYFGNPAGWAPSLTLPAVEDLYEGSVRHAMKMLYIAQWFEKQDADTKSFTIMKLHAIDAIQEERRENIEKFNKFQNDIPQLQNEIEELDTQIAGAKSILSDIEKVLRSKARTRVLAKHWISLATNVISVIPYGQPALNMAANAAEKGSNAFFEEDDDAKFEALGEVLSAAGKGGELGLEYRSEKHTKTAEQHDKDAQRIKERKYAKTIAEDEFNERNASMAREFSDAAKKSRKKAKKYEKTQEGIGNFIEAAPKAIANIKALLHPEQEIEAKLQQLEAHDPEFKRVTGKIRELNKSKSKVCMAIMQAINGTVELQTKIGLSHFNEATVFDSLLEANQSQLSGAMLSVASHMGDAAVAELVRSRYQMIKAYENLMLEPFEMENSSINALDISSTIKNFSNHVKWSHDKQGVDLTDDPKNWKRVYDNLKGILEEAPREIASKIVAKATSGHQDEIIKRTSKRSFALTKDQLEMLNTPDQFSVSINLAKIPHLIPFDKDKVVITNFSIKSMKGELNPNVRHRKGAASRTCRVDIKHFCTGLLKSKNTLYKARYGSTAAGNGPKTDAVKTWEFNYDEKTKKVVASEDDLATSNVVTESFERMGKGTRQRNIRDYFKALPAWTEIGVQIGDRGNWFKINELVITVELGSVTDEDTTTALDLRAEDGQAIPVWITDNNNNKIRRITPVFETFAPGKTLLVEFESLSDQTVQKLVDGNNLSRSVPRRGGQWKVKMRKGIIRVVEAQLDEAKFDIPLFPLSVEPIYSERGINSKIADVLQSEVEDFFGKFRSRRKHRRKQRRRKREPEGWRRGYVVSYAYAYEDKNGLQTNLSRWTEEISTDSIEGVSISSFLPDPSRTSKRVVLYRRFRRTNGKSYSKPEKVIPFKRNAKGAIRRNEGMLQGVVPTASVIDVTGNRR